MSAATKTTVMALLAGDAQLTALLAKDPFAAPVVAPAIYGNNLTALLDQANGAQMGFVYPCITWRVQTSSPTKEFAQSLPAAPGAAKTDPFVEEEIWNFEIWTQESSTLTIEAIATRLRALLHYTAFPLTPSGGAPGANGAGRVFYSCEIVAQPDLYDPTITARYGLYAYRLRVTYPPS